MRAVLGFPEKGSPSEQSKFNNFNKFLTKFQALGAGNLVINLSNLLGNLFLGNPSTASMNIC
jgi:hypothetical protein